MIILNIFGTPVAIAPNQIIKGPNKKTSTNLIRCDFDFPFAMVRHLRESTKFLSLLSH